MIFMGPYHPSHLNAWLWCAKQLSIEGFERVDDPNPRWSTQFGTIIHEAIEHWHNGKGVLLDLFRKSLADHTTRYHLEQKPDDVSMATEALAQYAKDFHAQCNAENSVVSVRTEVKCRTTILNSAGREIKFEGTIDQIRRLNDGTIQVVDLKTGKVADGFDYEGLRRSYQLWTYSHAIARGEVFIDGVWQRLVSLPEAMILHFRKFQPYKRNSQYGLKGEPRKGRVSQVWITEEGLDSFEKRALQIVRALRFDIFPPNPSKCSLCSVTAKCSLSMGLELNQNETLGALEGIPGIQT